MSCNLPPPVLSPNPCSTSLPDATHSRQLTWPFLVSIHPLSCENPSSLSRLVLFLAWAAGSQPPVGCRALSPGFISILISSTPSPKYPGGIKTRVVVVRLTFPVHLLTLPNSIGGVSDPSLLCLLPSLRASPAQQACWSM